MSRKQHTGSVPFMLKSPRRVATITLIAAGLAVSGGRSAYAQRDQGRDLINGLLKTLIDSQISRLERKERERNRPRPAPPPAATPQMLQLRQLTAQAAQESGTLVTLLTSDMRRVPAIRSQFGNVLTARANASVLSQRAATLNDHRLLEDGVRQFDRHWRTTSVGLQKIRGLAEPCRQCLTRIDAIGQKFCDVYGIAPQLDRRQLIRVADSLSSELHHLADDIEDDLPRTGACRQLVLTAHNLEQRADLLSRLLSDQATHATIVTEYRSQFAAWRTLAGQLATFNNRHIDRDVERIRGLHRQMHEGLWLAAEFDRGYVRGVSASLSRDVADLFRSVSLDILIDLPESHRIAPAADELLGACQNLDDLVRRNEPIDDLVDAWQFLDQSWRLFGFYLDPVQSTPIRNAAAHVDQQVIALRDAMGIVPVFDARVAVQLAAALEGLADQLHYHVGRWHGRPGPHDSATLRAAEKFRQDARRFHSIVTARRSHDHLRRDCEELFEDWKRLRTGLAACETDERDAIDRLSSQATPVLVQLETLFAL